MKQLYSLQKRAIKFLMPVPNNYGTQTKVLCSQTTPSRQTSITQQMCFNAKGCSRQSPTIPERSMIPSERLHVHGIINNFCAEQGLISFNGVSPFRAL